MLLTMFIVEKIQSTQQDLCSNILVPQGSPKRSNSFSIWSIPYGCFMMPMEYFIWQESKDIWSAPGGHYFMPYGVLHMQYGVLQDTPQRSNSFAMITKSQISHKQKHGSSRNSKLKLRRQLQNTNKNFINIRRRTCKRKHVQIVFAWVPVFTKFYFVVSNNLMSFQ